MQVSRDVTETEEYVLDLNPVSRPIFIRAKSCLLFHFEISR